MILRLSFGCVGDICCRHWRIEMPPFLTICFKRNRVLQRLAVTSPVLTRATALVIKAASFDPSLAARLLSRVRLGTLFPVGELISRCCFCFSRPTGTPERLDGPKTRTHPVSEGELIQCTNLGVWRMHDVCVTTVCLCDFLHRCARFRTLRVTSEVNTLLKVVVER